MTSDSNTRPPEDDVVIWRYLSDWKFRQLLGTFAQHDKWQATTGKNVIQRNEPGQLWFSYPWTFGDDLEGTMPEANKDPVAYCDEMAKRLLLDPEEAERRKKFFLSFDTKTLQECVLSMSRICGVSCWHKNQSESQDMWDVFVPEQNGVAVRTTVGQLLNGLGYAHNSPNRLAQPSLCSIEYVDHKSYFLPSDGFRSLLGIIQADYSYENEIRLIVKSPRLAALPTKISRQISMDPQEWQQAFRPLSQPEKEEFIKEYGDKCSSAYRELKSKSEKGLNLPVKLEGLLDEVVIKVGATDEFSKEVADTLHAVGLSEVSVRESSI